MRHRLHPERRDRDLRGRRRVCLGYSRLQRRLPVQKHPRLLSLRPHPSYTEPAATHLADLEDHDDDDHDNIDDHTGHVADAGWHLAELPARLRVRLQRQVRGHRRVPEDAESLRPAELHQHLGLLQVLFFDAFHDGSRFSSPVLARSRIIRRISRVGLYVLSCDL